MAEGGDGSYQVAPGFEVISTTAHLIYMLDPETVRSREIRPTSVDCAVFTGSLTVAVYLISRLLDLPSVFSFLILG